MAGSPTQRALRYCEKRGWKAGIVERWLNIPKHPAGGVRKDLFGFIDLIVLDGRCGCLAVQVTSSSNLSSRLRKIQDECFLAADVWLHASNSIEVWGWDKRRWKLKDGSKSKGKRWHLRKMNVVTGAAGELVGVPIDDEVIACPDPKDF